MCVRLFFQERDFSKFARLLLTSYYDKLYDKYIARRSGSNQRVLPPPSAPITKDNVNKTSGDVTPNTGVSAESPCMVDIDVITVSADARRTIDASATALAVLKHVKQMNTLQAP